MARIIDGKKIAADLKKALAVEVQELASHYPRPPCLAVVLVGDDPASQVYVSHKIKACDQVGIKSLAHRLPKETTSEALHQLLDDLSKEPDIDGILLQLPLPAHLNAADALDHIGVDKDVDGLTPLNQGFLASGRPGLFSCTPLGCIELIRSTGVAMAGARAVVVGRSLLVGAPVARLLEKENATVTVIHSRTPRPQEIAREADILVVAAGRMHLVDEDWIKPGAVVIDVGIHRKDGKLTGDCQFDSVEKKASYVTPVPGGVGPMTITMLLKNCVIAYRRHMSEGCR